MHDSELLPEAYSPAPLLVQFILGNVRQSAEVGRIREILVLFQNFAHAPVFGPQSLVLALHIVKVKAV